MVPFLLLLAIVLVVAFFFVNVFNRLGKARVATQEGWSGMGMVLKQRNELVPKLVDVVNGYSGNENELVADVIEARNECVSAMTAETQIKAAKHLDHALVNLRTLTDQFPDLKANQNFQRLQSELDNTEDKINQTRKVYNGTAMQYNQTIITFPNSVVAGFFGFHPVSFFKEEDLAK